MKRTYDHDSNASPISKKSRQTVSAETNILRLPLEILTVICLLLELPDRKNIRLTCHSLYDACSQVSITSREKIVLRSIYHARNVSKILRACRYSRLNLEFQGLSLDTLPGNVWSQCGEKIYSLTFHWSSMNDAVLKNVITHCQNLEHWEIWTHHQSSLELLKSFDDLKQPNVLLKSLKIYLDTDDHSGITSNIWAARFSVIFPNLNTFGILCCCSKTPPNEDSSPCPKFEINSVDIPANVERLLIEIPSDGNWLKNSNVWNFRLKEIQTSFYGTGGILMMLCDFFVHQKLLEVVSLTVNDISDELIKDLLFHILEECRNLRRLCVNYPTAQVIKLSDYEFNLLLKKHKRLEFLKLRFYADESLLDEIKTSQLPVNRNLHTLIFDSSLDNIDLIRAVIKMLQNLKHLEICSVVTDEIIQTIIIYQENLEVLKIDLEECTDFGFTGRFKNFHRPVYSIKRLKNLQLLDINCRYGIDIKKDTFLEFILPKLKHFRFSIGGDVKGLEKQFLTISEHSPLLEVLMIDFEFKKLPEFCANLKYLYYVDCGKEFNADSTTRNHLKLYETCPSLRFVAVPGCNKMYYRDPFTRRIQSTALNNPGLLFQWSVEFAQV